MWTSDAERAETTARLIQAGIGLSDSAVAVRPGLYLAHTKTLVDLIGNADDDFSALAVVGHNPGLSELWDWLCDKPGCGLPTCGIVSLELAISRWSDLQPGCANLRDFTRPELTFSF
jgi:phosphohistidine phosphatase